MGMLDVDSADGTGGWMCMGSPGVVAAAESGWKGSREGAESAAVCCCKTVANTPWNHGQGRSGSVACLAFEPIT
jgi:hypothetical protein